MRLFVRGFSVVSALLLITIFQACKKNDTAPAPVNKPPIVTPPGPVAPVITDFNPKSGSVGTFVQITGTHFDSTAASKNVVKFNGVAATVMNATATGLTVVVPLGAATGKITVMVNSLLDTSAVNFVVPLPLKLSTSHGYVNQVIYLTGGNGFGTADDANGLAIYGTPYTVFSTLLAFNSDTLVLLVPYILPGVYTDSARVNGVMVSLGTFTIDAPSPTQVGVISDVTPGTAAKGVAASISVGNGSLVAGSTTVSLVALFQPTIIPVELPCTVTTLKDGGFGTVNIGFTVPNGIVTGDVYAIKVTVNGVSVYGGLNAWFTGG